jgi:hypothetical protein
MRSQVLPLTADCQAVVDTALRAVLAVLLKYSQLTARALAVALQLSQSAAVDAQALSALKALWRYVYVQQLRPWLTTSAQELKKRADKSGPAMTITAAYTQLATELTALAEVLLTVTGPSEQSVERVWSAALALFKQRPAAATLTQVVHKRQHAAHLRARALNDLRALLAGVSLTSVKQDVLGSFTPALKAIGGHYAAGLRVSVHCSL